MNETTETKNQAIARGLRELADFIEARPELPAMQFASAGRFLYAREELRDAMKSMGSCQKRFDDHYVTATVQFSGEVKLELSLPRDTVCKKIVTWDCGDASLLKELGLDEVPA